MRISLVDYKILRIFNSDVIDYPHVNTLHLHFLTEPLQSTSFESKQKSLHLIITLLSKLLIINHLVLTFD